MLVESLQEFIGETVYDPYGRVVGSLVSFESDADGVVQSIVIENAYKDIVFVSSDAVEIRDGRLIVWPEWKVLASRVIDSYQRTLKRLKGLEDMYSRGEIPSTVYNELRKKLSTSLDKLKEETKKLKSMLATRQNEIEDNNLKLERAIANLKVSYLAGEVTEKAYKAAIERLRSAKESNAKEVEDIKNARSKIDALESGAVAIVKPEAKTEQPGKSEAKEKEEAQTVVGLEKPTQPIPVKLVG